MNNEILTALITGILSAGVFSVIIKSLLEKKMNAIIIEKTMVEMDKIIKETEPLIEKTKAETENLKVQTELLKRKLNGVQSQVNDVQDKINKVVKYSLSFYLFDHLSKLYHQDEGFRYDANPRFERDLRLLRDLGYLELFYIKDLKAGDKLIDKIKLTELGRLLVEIRELEK